MMEWKRLAARAGKTDLGECEPLILTLTALSEIAAHHGDSVFDRIYMGYFDEADIKVEEIPVIDREKICLELIRNDFFRDLIFVFVTMDDYEYACQLVENHINNSLCSEIEYRNMVLQYVGMRMVRRKKLPWEIEYCLRNIAHQPVPLTKLMERYRKKEETYKDCVDRYQRHWQD